MLCDVRHVGQDAGCGREGELMSLVDVNEMPALSHSLSLATLWANQLRLIVVGEVGRQIVVFVGGCGVRCRKNWRAERGRGLDYGDRPALAAGVAGVRSYRARKGRGARQRVCAGCATDCMTATEPAPTV